VAVVKFNQSHKLYSKWVSSSFSSIVRIEFALSHAFLEFILVKEVKAYELRTKTKSELVNQLHDLKTELQTLRIAQVTGGAPARLAKIGTIRKSIARVLTVTNQITKSKVCNDYFCFDISKCGFPDTVFSLSHLNHSSERSSPVRSSSPLTSEPRRPELSAEDSPLSR